MTRFIIYLPREFQVVVTAIVSEEASPELQSCYFVFDQTANKLRQIFSGSMHELSWINTWCCFNQMPDKVVIMIIIIIYYYIK